MFIVEWLKEKTLVDNDELIILNKKDHANGLFLLLEFLIIINKVIHNQIFAFLYGVELSLSGKE